MTSELRRLVVIQHTIRDILELCQAAAKDCDDAGAKGLAVATYMLGEAFVVFSRELNAYVLKENSDESVDEV